MCAGSATGRCNSPPGEQKVAWNEIQEARQGSLFSEAFKCDACQGRQLMQEGPIERPRSQQQRLQVNIHFSRTLSSN